MDVTLDDALRGLMTYARSLSIMRTLDGRWQVSARTPHHGHVYTCHTDKDVADALRYVCRSHAPKPGYVQECPKCHNSGWLYGEINIPCDCGRRQFNRSDLFGEIYL
jgi:hypothetical protein